MKLKLSDHKWAPQIFANPNQFIKTPSLGCDWFVQGPKAFQDTFTFEICTEKRYVHLEIRVAYVQSEMYELYALLLAK